MSTSASLDAQSLARKERLAQLNRLKRKTASTTDVEAETATSEERAPDPVLTVQSLSLSGRNYDLDTRTPKLGFDNKPSADQETLEGRAAVVAERTRLAKEAEEKNEKSIDLFALQPKKPNWDLKRDV